MTETAVDSGRWRRALAEGIGTFFLVLIGPGAVMVDAYTHGALGRDCRVSNRMFPGALDAAAPLPHLPFRLFLPSWRS